MVKFTMAQTLVIAIVLSATTSTKAFQSFLPNLFAPPKGPTPNTAVNIDLENRLLAAIESNGKDNRLDNSDEIASLVSQLEAAGSPIPRPAIAPQVYGRWRLLQTTNADTASPIQRKAVDTTKFDIFQDIVFAESNAEEVESSGGDNKTLLVRQIVKFSENSELCVDALASTSAYPLPELTEREGTGKILGLNILGVSMVGEEAAEDPDKPDSRIRFVFDEGKFDFGSFTLPYPVPFRNPLFRDAVKGWIDITYLSDRIRISRGNKGTTFVLRKEE
mmetsp:Transcript_25783/g.54804  ORF Transcript_25783/g.54804 Transcript_25783/m.54804 type:complete len:276 (-) Transcript_25783:2754-3581(-)